MKNDNYFDQILDKLKRIKPLAIIAIATIILIPALTLVVNFLTAKEMVDLHLSKAIPAKQSEDVLPIDEAVTTAAAPNSPVQSLIVNVHSSPTPNYTPLPKVASKVQSQKKVALIEKTDIITAESLPKSTIAKTAQINYGKTPLANAEVYLSDHFIGITDEQGYFTFPTRPLKHPKDQIEISFKKEGLSVYRENVNHNHPPLTFNF